MTSCHPKPIEGSSSLVPYGGHGLNHPFILCGRQDIREGLEGQKDPNSVCLNKKKNRNGLTTILSLCIQSITTIRRPQDEMARTDEQDTERTCGQEASARTPAGKGG